jgi:hypothetical protein
MPNLIIYFFVDIVNICPKTLQFINNSLFRIKLYLLLSNIVFFNTSFCILKTNFLLFLNIREYYINRNVAASDFAKNDLVIWFML